MSLYTIRELSIILNVNPCTIGKWIHGHSDFPFSKEGPYHSFTIDIFELRDWMCKQSKQSIWRKYKLRLDRFIRKDSKEEVIIFGDLLNVKEKEVE